MRFSELWVREWVDPPVTTAELTQRLTLAGLEVDAVEPVAAPLDGVVIGRVLAVAAHPHAEQLKVCQVNAGQGRTLQIVCGAANVRKAMLVPVALPGARLPGGPEIQVCELRGIESQGMLCSGAELGLEDRSDGLLELPCDAQPGEALSRYLRLDDVSIEVDLTPNRGDCLSVVGMARELGAIHRCPVSPATPEHVPETCAARFPVTVEAPEDCPRYVGRVLRGIRRDAMTPLWMREKLRRSGVRSLGPIVDVTNYVALELGQPMHAFDLAKLRGGIRVRRAEAGESLALLDGQRITLDAETLVIADEAGPQALAGIMGGQVTAVSDETEDLFLESAFFAPQAIAGRGRRYGLHTESSHRFERGVDPDLARRAMERATALLVGIVGGQVGPIVEVIAASDLGRRRPIRLRRSRIARLLGIEIPAEQVEDILARLGMNVHPASEGWTVEPPSFRFDVDEEVDLIEEVSRLYGYAELPGKQFHGPIEFAPEPEGRVSADRLRYLLTDRGYSEAITYSFVEPRLQTLLDPQHAPLPLANPIAADMSVMRTSLWPGLVQAVLNNQRRQQARLRLFETGLVFLQQAGGIEQRPTLAAIAAGSPYPEQWAEKPRELDFYDIKGDVEAILAATGVLHEFRFFPAEHPALHPGQTAQILRRDKPIGWMGAIHPAIEQQLGLEGRIYLFELSLAEVSLGRVPQFSEISKFPAIRRDIAVVVDETVPAQALYQSVLEAAGESLQQAIIFDVYQGKGVPQGKKSLAIGLILQHISRTLTDLDVDAAMQRVIERLHKQFGAGLRGDDGAHQG